jgi:transcriptional regulator of aroF, aroG, tyrA and aromatic amino acid transport
MAGYEKKVIEKVLKESKSIREAARTLRISHTALRNKIKKHQLK